MIKKLRIKFVCVNMTLVTVMLIAILCLQYQSTRIGLEQDSLSALLAATESKPPQIPGSPAPAGRPCFFLREHQGQLQAHGDSSYDLTDLSCLRTLFQAAQDSGQESGVLQDYSLRFLRTQDPGGVCYIFTDITAEEETLSRMLNTCVIIGMAAFCVFFWLSVLLARWAVKPVQQAWDQQRQFVADASHELKTPLTVILTNAELLQSPDYGETDRVRFADSILAMSRQMRGLVESLLELARADNGQIKTCMEHLDFSKLVSAAVLPFEPLYFEQGLELDWEVEPGISVWGSRPHLQQIVEILLDNGRKYGETNSRIYLRLTRQSRNQCLLCVASRGTPLSPEDCQNVFKRFYRVDKARSMNHSYGLGLPIAKQIVLSHRGRIWAESWDGWNYFSVSLPVKTRHSGMLPAKM